MHLTATTLRTFLECETKYFLHQVLGFKLKALPDYVNLGRLVHDGLEVYWQKSSKAEACRHMKNVVRKFFLQAETEEINTERLSIAQATACAMVGNLPWPVEHMDEAEQIFFTKPEDVGIKCVCSDHMFCGKRDGKYTDGKDKIVRDYKTTSDLKRYSDDFQLLMDFQASFYIYTDLDEAVNAAEFCVIKRPAIRQRKKQKEPFWKFLERIEQEYRNNRIKYYGRYATYRDRKSRAFLCNLQNIIYRLDECLKHGLPSFIKNYASCRGYGNGCVYLPICTNQSNWQERYEQVGPDCHPELGIVNGERKDAVSDGEEQENIESA